MSDYELEKTVRNLSGRLGFLSIAIGQIIQYIPQSQQQVVLFGLRSAYPTAPMDKDQLAGLEDAKRDLLQQFEHIPFPGEYLLPLVEITLKQMGPLDISTIQDALSHRYLLQYEIEPLKQILLKAVGQGRLMWLEDERFGYPFKENSDE